MAPNWDDICGTNLMESSKGFDEQRKQYQDAQAAEQAALGQAEGHCLQKRAQQELERASQEAYIARTMAGKKMPQMLAAQGISGGMTETTASNIFRDYLRSKSAADASYNTAMSDLQTQLYDKQLDTEKQLGAKAGGAGSAATVASHGTG